MKNNLNLKVAIASGKGGTGKTLVATNLFAVLKRDGKRVVLVDCDAEAPNVNLFFNGTLQETEKVYQKVPVIHESDCTYCGKCHDICHYNAIFSVPPMKIIKVLEDLCHGCGACKVVCETGAITEKDSWLGDVNIWTLSGGYSVVEARNRTGVMSPVRVIKAATRKTDREPLAILDAPPGTSCPFIQTVNTVDYVVLVTEPTPFGLSDLRQSVQTLRGMGKPCGVIINRAGLGDRGVYDYLDKEKIPLLMEIDFDRKIAEHYAHGKLIVDGDQGWNQRFRELYQNVVKEYGNSNHQR